MNIETLPGETSPERREPAAEAPKETGAKPEAEQWGERGVMIRNDETPVTVDYALTDAEGQTRRGSMPVDLAALKIADPYFAMETFVEPDGKRVRLFDFHDPRTIPALSGSVPMAYKEGMFTVRVGGREYRVHVDAGGSRLGSDESGKHAPTPAPAGGREPEKKEEEAKPTSLPEPLALAPEGERSFLLPASKEPLLAWYERSDRVEHMNDWQSIGPDVVSTTWPDVFSLAMDAQGRRRLSVLPGFVGRIMLFQDGVQRELRATENGVAMKDGGKTLKERTEAVRKGLVESKEEARQERARIADVLRKIEAALKLNPTPDQREKLEEQRKQVLEKRQKLEDVLRKEER